MKDIEKYDNDAEITYDKAKPKVRWYRRTGSVVIAVLLVGPLALPMIWFNPSYSRAKKIIATVAIVILTLILAVYTEAAVQTLTERLAEIRSVSSS